MDLKRWRHVILIWVCLEVICFGGIHYGWGTLVYILKDEGIHEDLCIEEPRGETNTTNSTTAVPVHCPDQDARFNLYYSVAISAYVVFVILGGTLFSKIGTRIVRLIFINMCRELSLNAVLDSIVRKGLSLNRVGTGGSEITGNTKG
ncbi:hypothetical protein CHS0354_011557 [Potamilus streckersoni]|uniref:Uncharacterized protein n=1 Tax=Potamilus streckersoni TaxID=2493646 RepID=A0AAE0RRM2_9BIVA|nr:hypothetical protein CHS0354_011557 [Potamilus streckersoni]